MKINILVFLLIAVIANYAQTKAPDNFILPLPQDVDSSVVKLEELNNAINRLHQFSEYIYNPVKVTRINSISFFPKNLTDAGIDSRWGFGSWGRGLFSKFIDRYLFMQESSKEYSSFFNEHPSIKNHYWGTHPIVAYCARTIRAYLNMYSYSTDPAIRNFCSDRIVNGSKYLITQQRENGSFVQWHWRMSKDRPNINDEMGMNDTNSYSTANAIVALSNAYFLLSNQAKSDSLLLSEIYSTIEKAGRFLSNHDNSGAPKNYIAFSVWGLVNAYKVTNIKTFLDAAISKYSNQIKDFQDENGAWNTKNKTDLDYHDAHPPYMGIILRALVELYDVLPTSIYNDLRPEIKKKILKGINHFLVPGIVNKNFPGQSTRLKSNGGIVAYRQETEYVTSEANGLQLILALIEVLESKNLLTESKDIDRVNTMLKVLVKYQVQATNRTNSLIDINSDIFFESFTKYYKHIFLHL